MLVLLSSINQIVTSIKKDIIVNNLMKSKGVYLLVSNPKAGKSMLALQLSCSVCNGTQFLGYNDLLKLKKSNEAFKKFKPTWFVLADDQPITTHKFYSRRDLYANKAGLKRIRIHDFRHSCTSALISASTPITAVSNFLGHADSTETLETYAHLIKKDYQKITNYFDNIEQQYNQKSEE